MGAMTKKNCEMQATHNSQMGYKLQLGYIYIYNLPKEALRILFLGLFSVGRVEKIRSVGRLHSCT